MVKCTGVWFNASISTTDAVFALRLLMEKYREGESELPFVLEGGSAPRKESQREHIKVV